MQHSPFKPAFILLLCFTTLAGPLHADTHTQKAAQLLANLNPHPRLFLSADDFQSLQHKIKQPGHHQTWFNAIRKDADNLLNDQPVTYRIPDGKRLLSVCRRVMNRTYTLALAYKLTNHDKYKSRLYKELSTAGQFKDWNPSHFLDTAEMTHAFAIAYDWLYHDWSDTQRQFIKAALIKHGLTPGIISYTTNERYGWWTSAVHNWNQVCNAGMLLGALALGDETPDRAQTIIAGSLKSIPRSMKEFAPDGGYKEGPSYWSYGVSYATMYLAALKSACNDTHLLNTPGLSQTSLFPLYMTSPTHQSFNFADGRPSRPTTWPAMFLAAHFDQPAARWFAAQQVKYPTRALIWFKDAGQSPQQLNLPTAKKWIVSQSASMRQNWTDPNAAFVAFKAGLPYDNHAQCDIGTFVYDVLGHRWAIDLGKDNYNLPGYFNRPRGRWHFYRNRAEAHNTIVINPSAKPDQNIKAEVQLNRLVQNSNEQFATTDMTPAYTPHVKQIVRAYKLINDTLLIQDEITPHPDQPAEVYWFMHTDADIQLTPNPQQTASDKRADHPQRAILTKGKGDNQKQIEVILLSNNAQFEIRDAKPFKTSPTVKGQQTNRGIRKLTVHLNIKNKTTLRVILKPLNSKQINIPTKPISDW